MMDTLLTALLQFGIGGAMAAAVISYLWWLSTKTIPQLIEQTEKDRAWLRDEGKQKRTEYLASLTESQKCYRESLHELQETFQATLTRVEARHEASEQRWNRAVDELCARLEQIEQNLTASKP